MFTGSLVSFLVNFSVRLLQRMLVKRVGRLLGLVAFKNR